MAKRLLPAPRIGLATHPAPPLAPWTWEENARALGEAEVRGVWTVEEREGIVGRLTLRPYPDPVALPATGTIRLDVARDREDVARELLTRVIAEARHSGARRLVARVPVDAAPALRAFRERGFSLWHVSLDVEDAEGRPRDVAFLGRRVG